MGAVDIEADGERVVVVVADGDNVCGSMRVNGTV